MAKRGKAGVSEPIALRVFVLAIPDASLYYRFQ